MDKYKIAETANFQKKSKTLKYNTIYPKLLDYVYPVLRNNPFFGPNIKKLKGEFSELYRFRIGDYRVFYKINTTQNIVFVIDVEHRKNAYK